MEHETQAGSARDFLTILFKHKYKIIIVFLIIVVPVTIFSFMQPPVYEAESSMMVKFGREYIYRPEVGNTGGKIIDQAETLTAEMQILTSRDLIEKVIKTIGVYNIYPDMANAPLKGMTPLEAAIPDFRQSLSTQNIRNSNVIKVSFQHKDPEVTAGVVNLLVELYKEKHLQVLSNSKSSFLEQQLAAYRVKLKESEDKLEAFKEKHGVFSLEEQRSLLLQQRVDLDITLKIIQNRVHELEQIFSSSAIRTSMAFGRSPFASDTEQYRVMDDAKAGLLTLQLRERELLGRYNEGSIMTQDIRKEIQRVQEFLREQEETLARAEMDSLNARGAAVKQQINMLEKGLRTFDLAGKELKKLRREAAAGEENYKIYLSKLEEARISEDMDRRKLANISVIQEAFVPALPVKPRKALNILLGIIMGSFAGLGFAFFSEYLSQSLSTPESAERRLNLPVLAAVSYKKRN